MGKGGGRGRGRSRSSSKSKKEEKSSSSSKVGKGLSTNSNDEKKKRPSLKDRISSMRDRNRKLFYGSMLFGGSFLGLGGYRLVSTLSRKPQTLIPYKLGVTFPGGFQ